MDNQPTETLSAGAKQMKKEIAQLKAQLASLTASPSKDAAKKKQVNRIETKTNTDKVVPAHGEKAPKRPKPWYCFNCGEDGHISSACSGQLNSTLVDVKRKELGEKQRAWDKVNGVSDSAHLNQN